MNNLAFKNIEEQVEFVRKMIDYSNLYFHFLDGKCKKIRINELKKELKLPKMIYDSLEELCNTDKDFSENEEVSKEITAILPRARNKNWYGFWKKASGKDLSLFINWISSVVKYEKYRNRKISVLYKEINPNMKYVPYPIHMAEKIINKYF